MKIPEIKMKIEAEYRARNLYVDLLELACDEQALLIQGLSVAINILNNDLVALLPPAPPAPPPPAPTPEPAVTVAQKKKKAK